MFTVFDSADRVVIGIRQSRRRRRDAKGGQRENRPEKVALGTGLGLLLAGKVNKDQRRTAGWSLLAVGALTTVPILMNILKKPALDTRLTAANSLRGYAPAMEARSTSVG